MPIETRDRDPRPSPAGGRARSGARRGASAARSRREQALDAVGSLDGTSRGSTVARQPVEERGAAASPPSPPVARHAAEERATRRPRTRTSGASRRRRAGANVRRRRSGERPRRLALEVDHDPVVPVGPEHLGRGGSRRGSAATSSRRLGRGRERRGRARANRSAIAAADAASARELHELRLELRGERRRSRPGLGRRGRDREARAAAASAACIAPVTSPSRRARCGSQAGVAGARAPASRQLPAVAGRRDVVGDDREGRIARAARGRSRRAAAAPRRTRPAREPASSSTSTARAVLEAAIELEHDALVDDDRRVRLVERRPAGHVAHGVSTPASASRRASAGRIARARPCRPLPSATRYVLRVAAGEGARRRARARARRPSWTTRGERRAARDRAAGRREPAPSQRRAPRSASGRRCLEPAHAATRPDERGAPTHACPLGGLRARRRSRGRRRAAGRRSSCPVRQR